MQVSVPCISTFCSSLFVKAPTHCLPGSHRQPLAYPFQRHRRFLAQSPRQRNLHRIALAAQRQIGFPSTRLPQPGFHQPFRLVHRAFLALLAVSVLPHLPRTTDPPAARGRADRAGANTGHNCSRQTSGEAHRFGAILRAPGSDAHIANEACGPCTKPDPLRRPCQTQIVEMQGTWR